MRVIDFYNWKIRQPIKYRYIRSKNFIKWIFFGGEYILCSALKVVRNKKNKYSVSSLTYLGKRHPDCLKLAHEHGAFFREEINNGEQGFITNTYRFVDRKEALEIANNFGQIIKKHRPVDELLSEDIY